MTPAVQFLQQKKVQFERISFEHQQGEQNYANEVIEKLNLRSEQVFKTLVLQNNEQQFLVAITAANRQVNTKMLAQLSGCKKVAMASPHDIGRITGYLCGGVSPFAQKKLLKTYLHSSALTFGNIYVSAGRRGVELSLNPHDLVRLLNAKVGDF